MKFKDINSLCKFLDGQVQEVLHEDVADVAKEHLKQAVEEDVYNAYDPAVYNRRYYKGGMGDSDNIEITDVAPDTIMLKDVAPLNNGKDGELDSIVYHGYGRQPFPRPFYDRAAETLEESGDAKKAMENGLKRRGFDVK